MAIRMDGLPSWWKDNDSLIAMLDLGFDEGGGRLGGKREILMVSAQMASSNSVRKFDRKWRATLEEAGIARFHSKDFDNHDEGVLRGLSASARSRLLRKLAKLIHRHLAFGVTAYIGVKEYNRLAPQWLRSQHCCAYTFCMLMDLVAAHAYLDQATDRMNEKANIIVADGHRNLDQASKHFAEMKEKSKLVPVKTYRRGAMVDHPLLQAADMLAFGEWRNLNGGDMEIYHALHSETSQYRTGVINCDTDLINRLTDGIERQQAAQREYWRNHPKTSNIGRSSSLKERGVMGDNVAGRKMSNVTEVRLEFKELNQISIPCGQCSTRILIDCADEHAKIPSECPTCGEEYGEVLRNALRSFRSVYRELSARKDKPVEVRVSVS